MDGVKARLSAYIAPMMPCCEAQEAALDAAAQAQHAYEQTDAARQLAAMPRGVTSFSVNGFSAALQAAPDHRESQWFPQGLCPEARAHLLLAGLLYRGVAVC